MSEPLQASFRAYLSDHVVLSFYARRLKKLQDLSIEMDWHKLVAHVSGRP